MGEHQARAEEIAAMKEAEEAQKKAEDAFKKIIETPLSKEEAEKAVADNDIRLAQLRVIRLKKVAELNEVDHAIEMATLDRSVIVRRALNPAGAAE
jgi:hypothetical protein